MCYFPLKWRKKTRNHYFFKNNISALSPECCITDVLTYVQGKILHFLQQDFSTYNLRFESVKVINFSYEKPTVCRYMYITNIDLDTIFLLYSHKYMSTDCFLPNSKWAKTAGLTTVITCRIKSIIFIHQSGSLDVNNFTNFKKQLSMQNFYHQSSQKSSWEQEQIRVYYWLKRKFLRIIFF